MTAIMLTHPETADAYFIRDDDPDPRGTFIYLVKDGYRPVGPRGQAAAAKLVPGFVPGPAAVALLAKEPSQ